MKPYITNSFKDGKHILPYQIEGMDRACIAEVLAGSTMESYEIPRKQSLKSCWQFRVNLDNGFWLEFSSACTEVGEWEEVGSLNITISNRIEALSPEKYERKPLIFKINGVESLTLDNKYIFSECGLVLIGRLGELTVAAGISPGSVSIKLPNQENEFEPELEYEEYSRCGL